MYPDEWRSVEPVERWKQGLELRIGVGTVEIDRRVEVFLKFCDADESSPDWLLETARKDHRSVIAAAENYHSRLIVESFLIHNGVNVFGAIVCMPRTTEQLREQGPKWSRSAGRPG